MGAILYAAWRILHEPIGIVLPPLALAAVIVYLLNPMVSFLAARRIPRLASTAVAYIVLIGAMVGLGSLIGPLIVDQTGDFVERVPEIATSLLETTNAQLSRFGLPPIEAETAELGETIQTYVSDNTEQVLGLLRGAGTVAGRILHALLTVVLAPILAFYLLVDLPRVTEGIRRLIPPDGRGEVFSVGERILTTVGRYFRGQLGVAAFVAVGTALGLWVVGLPFWALVGTVTGLFNLVPLIGPFVGGIVGVIVAFTVGDGLGQAAAVVVVVTLVQQIDNHAITPVIHARTVKVHPITVIVALLVAGSLYGILGMLVAIPVVATVKLVVLHLVVTHMPSMSYLAAEGPGLFGTDLGPARPPGAPDGGGDGPRPDEQTVAVARDGE